MQHPTTKRIGNNFNIRVDEYGYPYWTRMMGKEVNCSLNQEEARDLLYALQRIVAYLDYVERKDA